MPLCLNAFRKKARFQLMVIASVISFGSVASTMGQTWTQINPPPTSQDLMGIAFAKNQFVAVGFNGTIVTSTDGNAWTLRTSGVSKTLFAVGASDSLYVAVGDSGTILTSKNGITWTSRTSNTLSELHGVAWNGTTFVAAGFNSAILTSTDGVSWTTRTLGNQTDIHGVAWGNNMFVVAGFDGMNGTINTSSDGTTWTSQTIDAPDGLLSIAWCGNAFIAGSSGMVVSFDGITWTTYSSGLEFFVFNAAGHAGNMVTVGDGGSIYYSSDDSTWTSENSGVNVSLNGVTWGGTVFVAVGSAGTIITSTLANPIINKRIGVNDQSPRISVAGHTINISLFADAKVSVRLYSMQGSLVRSINRTMTKGEHTLKALSGLSKGKYLLSFSAGDRTIERSVFIVK